jgi:GT2 family glycosyltransferase
MTVRHSFAQQEKPLVSVIVLNYNGLEHLPHNLDALLQQDYPSEQIEVLLVDNASTDGSVEWVAAHFPSVRILRNETNLGFAAGNMAGARAARGEWIAFLNPDTRAAPNWLSELIQPALRDPGVIAIASRMLSWDGNTIDFADAAMNFMGWGCQPGYGSPRLHDFQQDKYVLFACGGAMLVKRRVFLEVGGFDPDFFAYSEDVDLGWRLWLMGHKVALAASAVVHHRHHGTWANVSDAKRWVLAERNALYTIIKNYSDANLVRILPAALLLMLQRAFLDVRPAPDLFEGVIIVPDAPAFDARYYFDRARQMLRQRTYREFIRRTIEEVERRWQRMRAPISRPTRSWARPIDGHFEVPTVALSRLIAGREALRTLPTLLYKRQAIQSARKRSDQQVFPLFRWALLSNFDDDAFIHAMRHVVSRFGLADIFAERSGSPTLDRDVSELSSMASRLLLEVMDRIFTASSVPEAHFRLDGPQPPAVSRIPFDSVAMLVEANRLLWLLPRAPLDDVLSYLADGCRQILDSVTPAHG